MLLNPHITYLVKKTEFHSGKANRACPIPMECGTNLRNAKYAIGDAKSCGQ